MTGWPCQSDVALDSLVFRGRVAAVKTQEKSQQVSGRNSIGRLFALYTFDDKPGRESSIIMLLKDTLLSYTAFAAAANAAETAVTEASQAAAIVSSYQAQISSLNAAILSQEAAVTAAGTAYNAVLASIQSEAASLESSLVSAESAAYASLIGNATGVAATTATTTATATDGTSTGDSTTIIYGTTGSSSATGVFPAVIVPVLAGGFALLAALI
ncbi:hypothetical protein LQW54_012531 [Pestalotiopsis sp. IQ-011]